MPGHQHQDKADDKQHALGDLQGDVSGNGLHHIGGHRQHALAHRAVNGVREILYQSGVAHQLQDLLQGEVLTQAVQAGAVRRGSASIGQGHALLLEAFLQSGVDVELNSGTDHLADRLCQSVRENGGPDKGHKHSQKAAQGQDKALAVALK